MDILSSYDLLGPIFGCIGAVFAVAIGVSQIGGSAMKAMSKTNDTEVRKQVFSVMILTSALIEGVALFAAITGLGIVMNIETLFAG